MRRSLAAGLALVALMAGGAPDARAQTKQIMKFASFAQPDSTWGKAQEEFKKELERRSNGRIELQIFNNSSLGGNREVLEMSKLGTVDFVVAGPTHSSRFVPQVNAIVFPYLWKDTATMFAALDGPAGAVLGKLYEDKGFKIVAWWDNGFRHVTNSKRPINTVADFSGLKLRTLPAKVHIDFFRKIGVAATPMDWAEVVPALRQGTIDGQENPAVLIQSFRVYEVQKYYSLTAHVNEPLLVTMSKQVHDKLAPELRTAVMEAARHATAIQRDLNQKADESVLLQLKTTSMQVNDVSAETKAELRKIAADIYPQVVGELGPGGKELIDQLIALNR